MALRSITSTDRSELKNNVADADVILGVVDRETMLAAKKLKWVQTWAAGEDIESGSEE
jgi:phosphoglycerate dehydrogenase-like enzyme